MRFYLVGFLLMVAAFFWVSPALAAATPLDEETYLDFKANANGSLELTAAFSPRRAATVVAGAGIKDMVAILSMVKAQRELIASFVASHVKVERGEEKCRWEPELAHVPATLLEAEADGITVQAPLVCPADSGTLRVTSDLFGFTAPRQRIVIREELNEDFIELAAIDAEHRTVEVYLHGDVRPVFAESMGTLLLITLVGIMTAGGIILYVQRLVGTE